MTGHTALPRMLTDAVEVTTHPDRYADRPTLIHHARAVLASDAARMFGTLQPANSGPTPIGGAA